MASGKKPRVMWLLNHDTARKFDVAMLKHIGIEEIYLPKKYSDDIGFRSASVDYSEDINLTIPSDELSILNEQNWYSEPSREAWEIANRHFDILFFIVLDGNILKSISKHFRGLVLWRVFGLDRSMTYTKVLDYFIGSSGKTIVESIGNRFYFAQAYDHLHLIEDDFLSKKQIYIPLGMHNCQMNDCWHGVNKKIFFVCPDLGFNTYYQNIYNQFIKDFKGFNYAIGGAQPVSVSDPNVLGYVPRKEHEKNMQEMRVMFYHSTEPNHIHYHPFEAIKAGMPLVFMANGMLDRMGGKNLPGRCKTIKEARQKVERILNDDWSLIEEIRKTQVCLLDPMRAENCIDAWRKGFESIFKAIEKSKNFIPAVIKKTKRIAVILPVEYKGGTLRGAKLLAQAIESGARQAGENVEVIFCHLDGFYTDEDFSDLPISIRRRAYTWNILNREEANRALIYAGMEQTLKSDRYASVDDKVSQLMDCDLLILVSDRLLFPLLPIKPYICMVYDYIQRYEKFLPTELNQQLINIAHSAERVFVTSNFTRNDAIQFAGLSDDKVVKVPMLAPKFLPTKTKTDDMTDRKYFLWTTNASVHKNHENAFKALTIYYDKYDGQLECHITGVNSNNLTKMELPHLIPLREMVQKNAKLRCNVKFLGDLADSAYQSQLCHSMFLWHAGRIDNGTFSVIEAAWSGIPALSSDYPAMREINEQFNLNLSWMDPYDPENMAMQLKMMETESGVLKTRLPSFDSLSNQSVEKLSSAYWEAVKECL